MFEFEKVDHAERLLEKAVAELEPEVLEAHSAAALVERFGRMERLCAAGKALAARRMANSGVWRETGARSPAHWMAHRTGTTIGHAARVIETAERVGELDATDRALRAGELSESQVGAIASAAAASPESEQELLEVAATEGMATLKEHCVRVEAAASADELARYEAIRKARYFRSWTDAEGALRLDARLTPDAGAVVLAALEPLQDQIFKDARKAGRRERYEAYAADALVALAEGAREGGRAPSKSGPRAAVHVLVDHAALVRGHIEPGETCEIPGVGPVPVATARALAQDAWLSALVTKGTDITTVCHMGKNISARLRTAVEIRDRRCVIAGCDVDKHLEIDHIRPRDDLGPTKLENLQRLCRWHHYLKTHRNYREVERDGKKYLEPPERAGPAR